MTTNIIIRCDRIKQGSVVRLRLFSSLAVCFYCLWAEHGGETSYFLERRETGRRG